MASASSLTYSFSAVPRERRWMRSLFHLALAIASVLAFCQAGYAQSTFGTILGTVKDPSGSTVPMATVTLMNTGTNAERSAIPNLGITRATTISAR